ncbi:MAG TPA: Fur family transcriptional regulator [Anaerolineaceae bacterium]|nr:Fur family transcriptional regulator [Anaerolineaceae bacterium]
MSIESTISQQGYRLSSARKKILGILSTNDQPLSPSALFDKLKEQGEAASLVTVYRNLDLLARLGLAEKIYNDQGELGYLTCKSTHHHHHILCQNCNNTVEFEAADELEELIARAEAQTHYKISAHLLQFIGLCPNCQTDGAKKL